MELEEGTGQGGDCSTFVSGEGGLLGFKQGVKLPRKIKRSNSLSFTYYLSRLRYELMWRLQDETAHRYNRLGKGESPRLQTREGDQGRPKEASFIRLQVTVPSNGVEILTVLLVL